MGERYIILWRKERSLDWDHHVAFSLDEAEQTVANLKKRGVVQYSTAPLGEKMPALSSEY